MITAELPFVAIVDTVARPELSIITTLGAEDVHVGCTVVVDPLAVVPVAVNCCVCPGCTLGLLGEIEIEIKSFPVRKNFPHPPASSTGKVIAKTRKAIEPDQDPLFEVIDKRLRINLSMRSSTLLRHERACLHLMQGNSQASFFELAGRCAQLRHSLCRFQGIPQVCDQIFGILDPNR